MTSITPKASFDTICDLAKSCEVQTKNFAKTDKLRAVFLYDANGKLSVQVAKKYSFKDVKLWFTERWVDVTSFCDKIIHAFNKKHSITPTCKQTREDADALFSSLANAKHEDTRNKTVTAYESIKLLSSVAHFKDDNEVQKVLAKLLFIRQDELNANNFVTKSVDTIWQSFLDTASQNQPTDLVNLITLFSRFSPGKFNEVENDVNRHVVDAGLKQETCTNVRETVEDLFLSHIKNLAPMTPELFQKSTDELVHVIGGQWPNLTPEAKEFSPQIFKEMISLGTRMQSNSKNPKSWEKPLQNLNLLLEGIEDKLKQEATDKTTYKGVAKNILQSKIVKYIFPWF